MLHPSRLRCISATGPLLHFWSFIIRHDPRSPWSMGLLLFLVLLSIFLFGLISEHGKEQWRSLFRRVFQTLGLVEPDTFAVPIHPPGG